MSSIRIKTPSRLHFGLLNWGNAGERQFGGLGLMIEDPGLELVVEQSEDFEANGPHSSRALSVARSVLEYLERQGVRVRPVRIQVLRAPALHNGLGVGTQLSLAIARACVALFNSTELSATQLAAMTGRGTRSGIGIHGFAEGGLIVDAGRKGDRIPPRILRVQFPDAWSILVINPPYQLGLHGAAEIEAFRELPPFPDRLTDRLCGIILLSLVPALVEGELPEFGAALTKIQEIVGECFAPAQGGTYSSFQTEQLVEGMKQCGLVGIGQSSWGPTLYGFTDASVEERRRMRSQMLRQFDLTEFRIFWTSADNGGVRVISEH